MRVACYPCCNHSHISLYHKVPLAVFCSGPDEGQYRQALLGLVGVETQEDAAYEGAGDHPVEIEDQQGHKHAGYGFVFNQHSIIHVFSFSCNTQFSDILDKGLKAAPNEE